MVILLQRKKIIYCKIASIVCITYCLLSNEVWQDYTSNTFKLFTRFKNKNNPMSERLVLSKTEENRYVILVFQSMKLFKHTKARNKRFKEIDMTLLQEWSYNR